MTRDEKWMKIALVEAKLAMNENEVPVGAILVQENNLIAQAHNQPIKKNDPTAHAEIEVLRTAGQKLKNYRLVGATLYVTLEPCIMCFGAMTHARIHRVVYGAPDYRTGFCETTKNMKQEVLNHKVEITGGILEFECQQLLKNFFISRR